MSRMSGERCNTEGCIVAGPAHACGDRCGRFEHAAYFVAGVKSGLVGLGVAGSLD